MIVNYDRTTFIVQATGCLSEKTADRTKHNLIEAKVVCLRFGEKGEERSFRKQKGML
jgi:hypothetical protein